MLGQVREEDLVVHPLVNGIDSFAPLDEHAEGRELRDERDVVQVAVVPPSHPVLVEVPSRERV